MNISEYYQTVAGGGREEDEPRVDIVAALIPDSNLRVLDLGCFDGGVSEGFKKQTNVVDGADVHQDPLRKASEVLNDVFVVDLDQPFTAIKSDAYDVVVMSAVLEHVFDYENIFSEIKRILKPGGAFIHATPNVASLRGRIELMFGDVPNWYKNFEHIRLWTRKYLNSKLSVHGFKEEVFMGCFVQKHFLGRIFSRVLPSLSPIIIQKYILKDK
ncbi:hypothetical protein R50073_26870 [Maricurvus nonylphenolicus]|uniref:class I SAM-dependent methyltransferase n=1 Tax=Maricurvus nonylphenolicus TaxID=1008307 RepID=UPI0036F405E2